MSAPSIAATAHQVDGSAPARPGAGSLRAYLRALGGALPRELALGIVLLVLTGLSEGVGIALLVPVLGLAGVGAEAGSVGGIQALVERGFAMAGVRPTLEIVLVAFAVVVGGRAVLLRQQTVLSARIQQQFVLRLREELFRAIARANWLFLAGSRSSDFTHALTTDMDRVSIGTANVPLLAGSAVAAAVYLVLALAVAPLMTLFVLAAGLLVLAMTRGRTRAVARSGAGISRAGRAIHGLLADLLGGLKLIKSHGLERAASTRFERVAQSQSDTQLAAARNLADAKLWFDLGSLAILVAVVYVAVTRLDVGIVELLFVLLLFARVMPRVAQAQQGYQAIVSMLPSFASTVELRRAAEAAVEESATAADLPTPALKQGLRLEGVGFRYRPEAADPVIVGLDLEVRAGRITAIVGPSGSGKSTIADLLLGLLLPDEGRVVVDGVALDAATLGSWRGATGYVPQDTFLLNDSIRANLVWGASDATDAAIDDALVAARASAFVGALPEGLETVVGDRGVRLSGGERQRLALARALLRKPVLLVLDEATSQLDTENERQILADVAALLGRTTVVLITHRTAALGAADLVYLLEAGRVVASGSWDTVRTSVPALRQGLADVTDLADAGR